MGLLSPRQSALSVKTRARMDPKEPIVKQGWLHKRGGSHGMSAAWKLRHFRLTAAGLAYFNTDEPGATSLGFVQLRARREKPVSVWTGII